MFVCSVVAGGRRHLLHFSCQWRSFTSQEVAVVVDRRRFLHVPLRLGVLLRRSVLHVRHGRRRQQHLAIPSTRHPEPRRRRRPHDAGRRVRNDEQREAAHGLAPASAAASRQHHHACLAFNNNARFSPSSPYTHTHGQGSRDVHGNGSSHKNGNWIWIKTGMAMGTQQHGSGNG